MEPRDDASSSSIIQDPGFVILNPITELQSDQQPRGTGSNDNVLDTITEVRLRKLETGAKSNQEAIAATLSQIEADLTISKSNDVTYEKWAIKHDAQLKWATSKIRQGDDEREAIKTSLEKLLEQISEISGRLDKKTTKPVAQCGGTVHVLGY